MMYAVPALPASLPESLSPQLSSSLLTSSSSIVSLSRRSFVYDYKALPRRPFRSCGLNTAFNNPCGTLPSEGYVSRLVSLSDASRARQKPFIKLPAFFLHILDDVSHHMFAGP